MGVGEAPFRLIVVGAVSGSWWLGDLGPDGVPHATQRLGSPRGYYHFAFDGPHYVETYHSLSEPSEEALHASFNTPRFREWATRLLAFAEAYDTPGQVLPPVTRNDLGDLWTLTAEDLAEGTWVAVNVWAGSPESEVTVRVGDGEPLEASLTQPGQGEGKETGPEWADPAAVVQQSTNADMAVRSAMGGDETAGFRGFRGDAFAGEADPLPGWLLADNSQHLWRADLPAELPLGVHTLTVETTDRHGRTFSRSYPFEVVEENGIGTSGILTDVMVRMQAKVQLASAGT